MGTLDAYQALPSSKGKEETSARTSEFMKTPTAPLAPRGMFTPAAKDPLTQPLVVPPVRQAVTTSAAAPRQQDLTPAFNQPREEPCCNDECISDTCECLCQCACVILMAFLDGDNHHHGRGHRHHHRHHGRRR